MCLLNVTTGNPYFNAHLTRPLYSQIKGALLPAEHPLEGVARMFHVVREIQQGQPGMPVVGSGYSWLRQFFPQAAASNLFNRWVSLVGLGRLAFAYPGFPRDLRDRGVLDPRRVCIACSKCTQLMRDGGMAGCVVRDAAVYAPLYKRAIAAHDAAGRRRMRGFVGRMGCGVAERESLMSMFNDLDVQVIDKRRPKGYNTNRASPSSGA